MPFIYAAPLLSLALVAVGRHRPRPFDGRAVARDGRCNLAGVRRVDAGPDRWHQRRRRRRISNGDGRPQQRNGCLQSASRFTRRINPMKRAATSPWCHPPRRLLSAGYDSLHRCGRACRERARSGASRMARLPRTGAATASFAACGSKPTGLAHRRSNCGAGRLALAGHPSRSPAIASSLRSSAAKTRSSLPTASRPASPCGCTPTRPGSGNPMPAPVHAQRRP